MPRQFGDPPPPPEDADQAEAAAQARTTDARTQKALRRALDALKGAFNSAGGKVPKNLDDADHAMADAQSALSTGQDEPAKAAMGRAVAALQKGGQAMAQQMQGGGGMQLSLQPGGASQPGGEGQDGEEDGMEDGGGRGPGSPRDIARDPLGRPVGGNGQIGDDPDLKVPTDMERGRSRAIQDELRRRGADRERPKDELDYIDRLLKPF